MNITNAKQNKYNEFVFHLAIARTRDARVAGNNYIRFPTQRYAPPITGTANDWPVMPWIELQHITQEEFQFPFEIRQQAATTQETANVTYFMIRDMVRFMGFWRIFAIATETIEQGQLLETEFIDPNDPPPRRF